MNAFIWLGVIVLFVIFEAVSEQLVSIWFAAGATVALVVSIFTSNLVIQLVVFTAVSIACLLLFRKYFLVPDNKKVATNADRVIGATAVVTKEINNDMAEGRVKVLGSIWTARSLEGDIIPKGTKVQVTSIEGVKLIVKL